MMGGEGYGGRERDDGRREVWWEERGMVGGEGDDGRREVWWEEGDALLILLLFYSMWREAP